MILDPKHIEQVVSRYFLDKPVKRAWLFGSYARGEAREDSDVDLLLELDEKKHRFNYFDLARFVVDLENSLRTKVDIVPGHHLLRQFVRPSVDKDKKLIFHGA